MLTTFADRKLQAIELITQLEDEDLLVVIEQLLLKENQGDWASDLSDKDIAAINQGLSDLENGKKVSYEDFQEEIKKCFP